MTIIDDRSALIDVLSDIDDAFGLLNDDLLTIHADQMAATIPDVECNRLRVVQSALNGESTNIATLGYDVRWGEHIGGVIFGAMARDVVARLNTQLAAPKLLIVRDPHTAWLWANRGSARFLQQLARHLPAPLVNRCQIALGEPLDGFEGWKLSHNQAQEAVALGERSGQAVTEYARDPLLVHMCANETFGTSMCNNFLTPLDDLSGRGRPVVEVLEAYLAANQNTSAAAAALGVSRRTISKRLKQCEEHLGKPVGDAVSELGAVFAFRDLVT